jgi:predicted Zn-dependent peptidase
MRRLLSVLLALFFSFAWLPAGAAPITVQQSDPAAELAGVEVLLAAGLDRQTAKQNGLAALVAEAILHTPVADGSALQDAVSGNGGSITYAVDPRGVRFYLEGMSGNFGTLLALLQSALGKPDFSPATLHAAREALDRKIADAQRAPLTVGIDMLNRAFYQDSAGMPPYGLPATVATFESADAQAFYREHYRAGDAVVSAVGNLSALNANALSSLVADLPSGRSSPVTASVARLSSTSRELLARRDVTVPWLVAQYPAPALQSKDFGAMLILTSFLQRTLADVSEVPGVATRSAAQRGVGAYYNFDAKPANVIIYVDGGLGDPTRTFATALTVVNVLGHAKLSGDLQEMKSYAAGRLLEDTTTLQDRAWFAGVYAQNGVTSGDFKAALSAINGTTAADLQRVAAKYLGAPTIALVLPRTQQDVQSP